jgi:hypothetical protein
LYGTASTDFHIFYSAGKMLLAHRNPYVGNFIYYPPTALPLFALFALFDFGQAATLWALTYSMTFILAVYGIARSLVPRKRFVFIAIAFLLLFTSYPFSVLFGLGQTDLLLSSLTALSLAAYRLNHSSISAVVLAAAALLKGTPVVFLIYFVLFNRDLWYLVRFVAAASAIVCISLLIVPVDFFSSYLATTLAISLGPATLRFNESIPGALAMCGLVKIVPIVSFCGIALFAIFALISSRKPNRFSDKDLRYDGMFLLNTLVMLLFGTRSTVYPYVWIVLPLAIFLCTLLVNGAKARYLTTVCLATFLLNAVLSSDLLDFQTLPLSLLGNIILSASLIEIYLLPKAIFD